MFEITKLDTRHINNFRNWICEIPFDFTKLTIREIDLNTKEYTYFSPSGNQVILVSESSSGSDYIFTFVQNNKTTQVIIHEDESLDIVRS